ncbi:2355_t:CDS:1, partial [Scutellospora calospora]
LPHILVETILPNEDKDTTESTQDIANENSKEQEIEAILDKRIYY